MSAIKYYSSFDDPRQGPPGAGPPLGGPCSIGLGTVDILRYQHIKGLKTSTLSK